MKTSCQTVYFVRKNAKKNGLEKNLRVTFFKPEHFNSDTGYSSDPRNFQT